MGNCRQDANYGKLVIGSLRSWGILCLGLYRRMYPDPSNSNPNRYVITNPSASLPLVSSDQVCTTISMPPYYYLTTLALLLLATTAAAAAAAAAKAKAYKLAAWLSGKGVGL